MSCSREPSPNQIDNSLKYGRYGARIGLAAARHNERVVVSLGGARARTRTRTRTRTSTNNSLAADALTQLFARHYQSRQSVAPISAEGGKGLGLAIVQRTAQLHGSEVSIRCRPGTGITVEFWLPRSAPALV